MSSLCRLVGHDYGDTKDLPVSVCKRCGMKRELMEDGSRQFTYPGGAATVTEKPRVRVVERTKLPGWELQVLKATARVRNEYFKKTRRHLFDDERMYQVLQQLAEQGKLAVTADQAFAKFYEIGTEVALGVDESTLAEEQWEDFTDEVVDALLDAGLMKGGDSDDEGSSESAR